MDKTLFKQDIKKENRQTRVSGFSSTDWFNSLSGPVTEVEQARGFYDDRDKVKKEKFRGTRDLFLTRT